MKTLTTQRTGSARLGKLLRHWQLQSMLQFRQMLGGEEGAATSAAGPKLQRLRLEEVEYTLALRQTGTVQQLPGVSPKLVVESASGAIGRITLGAKQAGKRSAGNPHAPFDEAGAGNVAMVEL
jgi:hypothetical protein